MKNLLSQVSFGTFKGIGSGNLSNSTGGIATLASFITSVIGVMTIVAVIWFIFVFITGAIGIIAAGGDKGALENARKRITTGLIGLVVVIIATFVIDLIGYLLGFPSNGILNIVNLFNTLPK
jgi:hypothetical protein